MLHGGTRRNSVEDESPAELSTERDLSRAAVLAGRDRTRYDPAFPLGLVNLTDVERRIRHDVTDGRRRIQAQGSVRRRQQEGNGALATPGCAGDKATSVNGRGIGQPPPNASDPQGYKSTEDADLAIPPHEGGGRGRIGARYRAAAAIAWTGRAAGPAHNHEPSTAQPDHTPRSRKAASRISELGRHWKRNLGAGPERSVRRPHQPHQPGMPGREFVEVALARGVHLTITDSNGGNAVSVGPAIPETGTDDWSS